MFLDWAICIGKFHLPFCRSNLSKEKNTHDLSFNNIWLSIASINCGCRNCSNCNMPQRIQQENIKQNDILRILKSAILQGKLDGYREDKRRGKELNEDQKAAVAKYYQLSTLL